MKAVLLGNNPFDLKYCDGLAFSCWPHITNPPSPNYYLIKEVCRETKQPKPKTFSLRDWEDEGVLLLNQCVTKPEGNKNRNPHNNLGWGHFTFSFIRYLDENAKCVFILFGDMAQQYTGAVRNNTVIQCPYPHQHNKEWNKVGICNTTNEILGKERAIDWRLR